MIRTMGFYFGIIATVIVSSLGLVFIPEIQMFDMKPHVDDNGNAYPIEPFGEILKGRQVYVDLGCIYCHTQQVRPEGFGTDIDRGWGMRRSVARDYLYDTPHQIGTMRTGPDLMNIGARQPDDNWHYQHLYDPVITSPGSTMPRYPFLFEKIELAEGEEIPREAVRMPEGYLEPGMALVPNERGRSLVAYLKSMNHNYALPEVPQ